MRKKLCATILISLFSLNGCNKVTDTMLVEKDINQLIEKNITDGCFYNFLDPVDSISFNTVRLYENILYGTSEDKNYYAISIKDGDDKLLGQARALESLGFLKKVSNDIIKSSNEDLYYSSSILNSPIRRKLPPVEVIKGHRFKVTLKGEPFIKKAYISDGTIKLCIAKIKVERLKVVNLTDNRLKVSAELSSTATYDWVEDRKVIEAFGDLTDSLHDNSLIGLAEAYVIKNNGGYILEGNTINILK